MSSLEPQAMLDRGELQTQLAGKRGRHFWRALEELADSEDFKRQLSTAFPRLTEAASMDRRSFLKFLGASLALAGLAGCTSPPRGEMVPWVSQPLAANGDLPEFYTTALTTAGYAVGVLVESHLGRPTKIEGNPGHPASLGATDARLQAAVLQVWDPDRSQMPIRQDIPIAWGEFEAHALELRQRFSGDGNGLRVLSGRVLSPTLARQRAALMQRYPGALWHQYEPIDNAHALMGSELVTGRRLLPSLHLERAAVVLALDADFLGNMPARVRHASEFVTRRDPAARGGMSRLYAMQPTPSLTGSMADHVWPLDNREIERFARALAYALGVDSVGAAPHGSIMQQRVQAVAADLRAHAGESLVLVGTFQPAYLHALGQRINAALGNVGKTVEYLEPPIPVAPDAAGSLRALTSAMAAGQVDTLLMLDVNPVYASAGDLHFGERLQQVRDSIHLGLYRNETAHASRWHLPLSHPLEAWSDTTSADGVRSIVQPLLEPLYDSRSVHQVMAMMNGMAARDGRKMVQDTWRKRASGDFSTWWLKALQSGIASAAPRGARAAAAWRPSVESDHDSSSPVTDAQDLFETVDAGAVELLFRPDPHMWDGRNANNGWLQELPRPLTQLTWDNALLIAPELALKLGLDNGSIVQLEIGYQSIRVPVWLLPGQASHSVTVHLGYGRKRAGRIGTDVGFDVYPLRDSRSPWTRQGARLVATGEHVELALTQHHFRTEDSEPVRSFTLEDLLSHCDPVLGLTPPPPSLYPPRPKGEYSWGMAIDLNSCIGCKACTIACQAENNIPIVGADQVRKGREMHWIRVDRYYEGKISAPSTFHQPVPCMMCENAPCEVVCPVGATLHDSDGLNLQVYNRCVGTRFCSNNCPYKVRRFNFLQYSDLTTESLKGQRNPDVSVRNRGVMEKCTYCIQRIERAHINADKDSRPIADGEIVTACQAACPTKAIVFGDMSDPDSAVSRAKASPREYTMLEELNTRPHTTYAARVTNPNPALKGDAA